MGGPGVEFIKPVDPDAADAEGNDDPGNTDLDEEQQEIQYISARQEEHDAPNADGNGDAEVSILTLESKCSFLGQRKHQQRSKSRRSTRICLE
jgi:hypothetical protein